MAIQLMGATPADAARSQSSSGFFETAAPVTPAQKEIARLFKQISANAAVAGKHADRLESFTRVGSRLHFETHASELTGAKEAINAIGADFRRLQELRPGALPWQEAVIDRMEPMLIGLAGNAADAIEQLNASDRGIPSQDYREAVLNLYASTGQIRTLAWVNLDYAQAREKLNRLDNPDLETAKMSLVQEDAGRTAKAAKSLDQRVRGELLKLPYYGVFDYLGFEVDGDQVTLSGQVSWPALKGDAERVVRGVEGVGGVTNNIQTLPLSPNDDHIRVSAYWAIYGHSMLSRYRLNSNPPIRIIVENGNVTLKGVVSSDMERTVAGMQANGTPGVFSVTNHLSVGS